jgi:hypothetical protein
VVQCQNKKLSILRNAKMLATITFFFFYKTVYFIKSSAV